MKFLVPAACPVGLVLGVSGAIYKGEALGYPRGPSGWLSKGDDYCLGRTCMWLIAVSV